MTLVIVQVGSSPAMSNRKCSSTALPVLGVQHLGVELHAGEPAVDVLERRHRGAVDVAVTVNPGGACDTESPWRHPHRLLRRAGRRTAVPSVMTRSGVPPNSPVAGVRDRAAEAWAIAWKP